MPKSLLKTTNEMAKRITNGHAKAILVPKKVKNQSVTPVANTIIENAVTKRIGHPKLGKRKWISGK